MKKERKTKCKFYRKFNLLFTISALSQSYFSVGVNTLVTEITKEIQLFALLLEFMQFVVKSNLCTKKNKVECSTGKYRHQKGVNCMFTGVIFNF